MDSVPVTVLTGFLGAGKTTLLRGLLRRSEAARIAVLINEFGEVGLDHLLVEHVADDLVLLASGCLCCTVRGDLIAALGRLAARRAAGELSFERVIIETTGLADPAPILHTLMGEPSVLAAYRLDGIVTVVDAVHGWATLDAQPEAVKQAAVADRLVLSKTDLAPTETVARLSARLAALNPAAPILDVQHGAVDPALILNAGLFDPSRKSPDVAGWLRAEAYAAQASGHGHDSDEVHHHPDHHHHDPNRHDDRIRAFCLTFDRPLPWQGLATWLQMLVTVRGESLLRIKGVVDLVGHDRPVVIHGVQHVFHPPTALPDWPEGAPRRSQLVFIVRDLDRAVIEEGLNAFLAAADGAAALRAG